MITFVGNEKEDCHNKCFDGFGGIVCNTVPIHSLVGTFGKTIFRKNVSSQICTSQI